MTDTCVCCGAEIPEGRMVCPQCETRKPMKVLVACEESQEVCKAFRARGHEVYSCDIIEPSGGHPEWHILGDALDAIKGGASSPWTAWLMMWADGIC